MATKGGEWATLSGTAKQHKKAFLRGDSMEGKLETKKLVKLAPKTGIELGTWLFGLAALIVILIVSLLVWYLLVDPKTAIISIYPQPFGAWLFWNILTLVWFAFNFEFWCLKRLEQPALGAVGFVISVILSFIAIWIVNYGLGALDPAFAASRAGGAGFAAGAMFVLIAFYFYGASVAQWGHWPWTDAGLKQPLVGVGELLMCTVISLTGYLVLVYPNLAVWGEEGGRIVDMSTALGWFYSVIVLYVLTISITQNWPYSLCKTRAGTVISSIIGNFLFGTVFYYFALWLLKGYLIPPDVQQALGSGINAYPAELGVCFVLWLLLWTHAFGNWPNHLSNGVNMLVRLVITFVLGVFTYLIYYNWGFWKVLHEPAIAGSYGGDALLWMDLLVFFLFTYAFAFNFWPFKRKE